jgi:hypothetical protein
VSNQALAPTSLGDCHVAVGAPRDDPPLCLYVGYHPHAKMSAGFEIERMNTRVFGGSEWVLIVVFFYEFRKRIVYYTLFL